MSTKISALTAHTPPMAADDLIAAVDTSTGITKSIRADNNLLYTKTSLSTAQILLLNGTPIELVPAPGAGKVIIPHLIVFSFIWNSIAYTTNTALALIYDTGTSFNIDTTSLLSTGDFIRNIAVTGPPSGGLLQNKKLSVTVGTGNPAAGNSALDVYQYYQILTL